MSTVADPDVRGLIEDVLSAEPVDTSVHHTFNRDLWQTLTQVGLHRLTGGEEVGGAEAGWAEAAVLVSRTAFCAAEVPVVEHDLLAGWLAEQIGSPVGSLATVALLDGAGRAADVAWAPVADTFVVIWPDLSRVACLSADDVQVETVRHLADRPTGNVTVPVLPAGTEVSPDLVAELWHRGALARSLQLCGAMERAVELATEHVTTRVQFGRALAKFQVVQKTVVDIAAEAALARIATEAAVVAAIEEGFTAESTQFAIAAARSCAGHAVSVVVRGSHQLHGAIGTTVEHALHRFTAPMLAWRSEWGNTALADRELGAQALSAGAQGIWELLLGGAR